MAWQHVVVGALAAVGALIAVYFVAVRFGWMRPDARWIPAVCRMDEGSCARIVHTRWGNLLGVPNSVLGLLWFATCIAWSAGAAIPRGWMLAGAGVSVAVSIVLAYGLLARLRTRCVFCFTSHGISAGILLVLLFA